MDTSERQAAMQEELAAFELVHVAEWRQPNLGSPSAMNDEQSLNKRPGILTAVDGLHGDVGVPFENTDGGCSSHEIAASETGKPSSMATYDELQEASSGLLSASVDVTSVNGSDSGPQTYTNKTRFVIFWTEALACFLALASLLAMAGTLYPYQGNPLPQWPFSIGVNTLLSVYTVILRAAISFLLSQGIALQKWQWFDKNQRPRYDYALFDEATRGPWDAIKLLWRLSLRHIGWWSGCLLVLMVLLVGPSTQQVLHYTDCRVSDPDALATISRSNFFRGDGLHLGVWQRSINAAEQAAIDVGVQAAGQKVIPQCPSGNCTFPHYETVSYCSSCVDVSDTVNFEIKNDEGQNRTGVLSSFSGAYNYFASGSTANVSTFNSNEDGYHFLVGMPSMWDDDGLPYAAPYDPVTGSPPQGCNNAAINGTWRCRGFGAATCDLYPCIRTYETSVVEGRVTESLIDKASLISGPIVRDPYLLNAACLTKNETDFLEGLGYPLTSNQKWIFYNLTGFAGSLEPPSALKTNDTVLIDFERAVQQRGCLYAVNFVFYNILPAYLAASWDGTLAGQRGIDGSMLFFEGPQILQTLYNYGDFSFERTQSLFENVTESLTSYMRNNPGVSVSANSTSTPVFGEPQPDPMNFTAPAKGTVFYKRTCLVVRWPWMALPTALVVMTLSFFAFVLAEQQRATHNVRSWMSSPLPLLSFGLDANLFDTTEAPAKRQQDLRTIEKISRHTNARLFTGRKGTTHLETQRSQVINNDQRS